MNLSFPHKKSSRKNEVWLNCPFCITKRGKADEKFKLGLNLKTGLWSCFRCHSSSGNTRFDFLKNMEIYRDDLEVDLDKLVDEIDSIGIKEPTGPIDLEAISVPMDPYETPLAYAYATRKRGFSDSDIARLGIRVGKPFWTTDKSGREFLSKRWDGRIIFPFLENGKAMYAVGRSYNGAEPKYMNTTERSKGPYVYGLDKVKDGVAILCEGIISAEAAERVTGIPAVSLLGYYCTFTQLLKMRNKINTLYMCLDGGTGPLVTKQLEKQLLDFNFEVIKINLPDKSDPDDLGRAFLQYFDAAERISVF